MGFNSGFKGLNSYCYPILHDRATHMLVMLLLVLAPWVFLNISCPIC